MTEPTTPRTEVRNRVIEVVAGVLRDYEYMGSSDRAVFAPRIADAALEAAAPEAGALRDAATRDAILDYADAVITDGVALAEFRRRRATLAKPEPAAPEAGALRDALFDEYGVNVVDEALDVAIHSSRETQVNRDRWNAARLALRAALAAQGGGGA